MRAKGDVGKLERNLFPEIELFDSGERRRTLRRVSRSVLRGWEILIFFLVCAGIMQAARLTFSFWGIGGPYQPELAGAVGGMSAAIVANRRLRHPIRLRLRTMLNARGIPVCMRCGYRLCHLEENRCPECGTPFDARPMPDDTEKRTRSPDDHSSA